MKTVFVIITMLIASSVHAAESSKVYHSFMAEYEARVIIVPHREKDHYLLNFSGFEHDLDGSTLLYKKILNSPNSNGGYYYKMAGSNRVNFRSEGKQTLLYGTTVPYFEIFLENKPVTKMLYSGELNIQNREQKIRDDYHQSQGLTKSKVEAKKLINEGKKTFIKACNQPISVNVDWPAFEKQNQKTTPGMLALYLQSLARICAIDQDYLDAVNSITAIDVVPAVDGHKVMLTNETLTIKLDRNTPNVAETSYQVIYDLL